MVKILANDGIHPDGLLLLEEADFEVETNKIPQEELVHCIAPYHGLIVRSATKVTREIIDAAENLKIIGRAGVGLDNIDVEYARSKGIEVFNTPRASSRAVAELAFGHLFALARFLHRSNHEMVTGGDFKKLKKNYEKGIQLQGKTLGIIGFGRIGQEVGRMALGLGMKVVAHDPYVAEAEICIQLHQYPDIRMCLRVRTESLDRLLTESDFITLHLPGIGKPVITASEFEKMKKGVLLVNTARGGSIEEQALLDALNNGIVAGVGLDVFENEPAPRPDLVKHPLVSVSPHIGANTVEAQSYIGMELADKMLQFFGVSK